MKEDNRAARRVCRLMQALNGHALDGLTLTEIAKLLGDNASTTLRTLEVLAEEKLVIKLDSGRWALSLLMVQIATATASEITRKSARLQEYQQRVLAAS